MANVFVGFHDQRNSSRVLKPPGGDTSDIFGSDLIPDVVPQNSPRKEIKCRGSSIQDVLRTETVTTTVKEQKTTTSTNGTVTVAENNVCKLETNGESRQEVALIKQELPQQEAFASAPDVSTEVTYKVEQMNIAERSSEAEVTETDSAGNTKILLSESNSEGSVEKKSSCKKGSSIGAILNEDELLSKKKVKGQPAQRVPPGGYSSGLW